MSRGELLKGTGHLACHVVPGLPCDLLELSHEFLPLLLYLVGKDVQLLFPLCRALLWGVLRCPRGISPSGPETLLLRGQKGLE